MSLGFTIHRYRLSSFSILLDKVIASMAMFLEMIHSSSKSHFLSDSHCVVSENIHTPTEGNGNSEGRFQKEVISEGVVAFLPRFFFRGV